jgi:hypothetical protein
MTRAQDTGGILYADFVRSGAGGAAYLRGLGYTVNVNSEAIASCMSAICITQQKQQLFIYML